MAVLSWSWWWQLPSSPPRTCCQRYDDTVFP